MNDIIGRYKGKGIERDAFGRGIFVNQLSDNFSVLHVSEWLNRGFLNYYGIRTLNAMTLSRVVGASGVEREEDYPRALRQRPEASRTTEDGRFAGLDPDRLLWRQG